MANNIEKLLAVIISPAQDIEDALQQLKTERWVDTAVGDQLDIIGRIVGQPREGRVDDDYRRFIRARIATNNSDGTFEDLITVAFLVIYDENAQFIVTNEGTATVRLHVYGVVTDPDLAEVLYSFARSAASAGVRIVVEWGESALEDLFQLDDGPGLDEGYLAGSLG
jgi:hypothetical protein